MSSPFIDLALLPLVLGCAAPTAPVAAPQEESGEQRDAPLRFGDPEELAYDVEFFPGARYDPAIPTPDSFLGQQHGSRLAHHDEILACFRAWAAASDRVRMETFARTHEGRELVWVALSSPENVARLDAIRADMAALDDPRGLDPADERRILAGPAVAWMGYSIHGDELSGSDASLALGYHLVAGLDEDVAGLLEDLVVVIDPCLNPDGRERIIGMVEQSAGLTPNLDYASMHRGRWPWGRGNHYLFDMNRDWMAGTQPETRGRWSAVLSFHPQLFVDAHEMGSDDTFLFYPQAKPHNPHLPSRLADWQRRYGAEAGRAFDAHGWAYYTREWADAWGPFYSDAWASLTGATGILYEQAFTAGFPLRRESGRILTYREAVHHQLTASLANLRTLRASRAEALRDYLANGRANVAADTPGNDRMLVIRPDGNSTRREALLRTLLGQGIEVLRAEEAFEGRAAELADGTTAERIELPAGTLIVPARQPARARVRAFLDLDVRYPDEALQREREELERKGSSLAYDRLAWSLVHANDLDAAWVDTAAPRSTPVTAWTLPRADLPEALPEPAPVAWCVDARDDGCLAFAARAMELGLAVHWADEAFTAGGTALARGSLMVRRSENDEDPAEVWRKVRTAALQARVDVVAAPSGRAPDDEQPDLGGQHFHLLARPRVALLANAPVSPDGYGHLWHHLDRAVGVPFSILDAQSLGDYDLRRFNVLVLPPAGGIEGVLEPLAEDLATWIENGGTLVACGSSAEALTAGRMALSQVTLRRHALDDLGPYRRAAELERAARDVVVDADAVWNGPPAGTVEASKKGEDEDDDEESKVSEEEDARARLFAPRGAVLRARTNPDAWITSGFRDVVPVPVASSRVLLAKDPVTTAVRLDEAATLRLSGLLWPEARARLADGAWLTVERKGRGQIVLFAEQPAFRGHELATARLFAAAVVLGPGLGADQPDGW